MAIIKLEDMHFFANHGFYEEETILGNEFVVNVQIDAQIAIAAMTDDLFKSVNYETVFFLCKSEMKKTAKLLETVAQRIVDRIEEQFDGVKGVQVEVIKLNPPLDGLVRKASVTISSGSLGNVGDIGGMEDFGF